MKVFGMFISVVGGGIIGYYGGYSALVGELLLVSGLLIIFFVKV